MIGTFLDKYEVLQKIGEGGMATVYLGRHVTLGRDVAIKVLHPHLSSASRNRKRFAREARAIEHLRHENILEIYDYSGTDQSECYIITEYVDGETLSSVLHRAGRLPSEVTAIIGHALAEALSYAHDAGILHRDLKPDNVMIRKDGTVKLMDFGIARFLDESQVTMTGALVGSPAFMSPEQAREAPLDARSDLFSLGTLLFHLVTGHLPFTGSNPSLILKNIIEGNRPQLAELTPTVSATLSDVIERCLELDPADRFTSAHDVVVGLAKALKEVEVDPVRPEWSTAAWLRDPDAYQARLDDHLGDALMRRGKLYLEEGEPLAALRIFNRLLSIDEDNPEVLQLVQGLHAPAPPRRRRRAAVGVALGLALLGAVGMAAVSQREAEHPRREAPVAIDLEPLPLPPAPAPEPVPEPAPVVEPEVSPPVPAPRPAPKASFPPAVRTQLERFEQLERDRAEASKPARVEIRTRQPFAAEIYENGDRIGDVRQPDPLEVAPGEHLFVLRGAGIHDREVPVAVASGEHRRIDINDLRPLPVDVAVEPACPESCVVYVNGDEQGTVASLDRTVKLPDPSRSNIVVLDCGERGVFEQTFASLATLYPVFSGCVTD